MIMKTEVLNWWFNLTKEQKMSLVKKHDIRYINQVQLPIWEQVRCDGNIWNRLYQKEHNSKPLEVSLDS